MEKLTNWQIKDKIEKILEEEHNRFIEDIESSGVPFWYYYYYC